MDAKDPWPEVLTEALGEDLTQPLVGTKYRAAVDAAAKKRGLRFPPQTEPALRFITMIQRYPAVVSVMRRPGQDFVVAPSGRSDLLTKGFQSRFFGIRKDLFDAFTMVGAYHPYYHRVDDRVIWRPNGIESSEADTLVLIPQATVEAEKALREEFVATLPDEGDSKKRITNALNDANPLKAFGRAVKETGVQKQWHSFRTERLTDRIQRWARESKVEWKDSWLTDSPPDFVKTPAPRTSRKDQPPESINTDSLSALFAGLDAADMQRISIPLDLVLKAISRKP